MYACPNCAGNLTFDIQTQKLRCAHCDTQIDPYEYHKERDAEESDAFGVTVFHCPQCGAEIMSTDEAATGFCSYCGASTIFDTRIKDEKKPDYIIPFSKTKDDCKKAYRRLLRKAPYAPKEMRDPAFLERATGIYMPYWVYEFQLNEKPSLRAGASFREGDYVTEGVYEMTGRLRGDYMMSYDASSFFHDRISEAIAPYPAKAMQPFAPSFLSGFYADTADVGAKTYLQDAKNHVGADAYQSFIDHPHFDDVSPKEIKNEAQMNMLFHLDTAQAKRGLFPVWFLTWRKKDRVAYAVMNGATGKLSADIPISAKRFIFGALLTAVPFFLLYTMLLTTTASSALAFTCGATLALSALLLTLLYNYTQKRDLDDDVGVLARRHQDAGRHPDEAPVKSEFVAPKLTRSARKRGYRSRAWVSTTLYVLILVFRILLVNGFNPRNLRRTFSISLPVIATPAERLSTMSVWFILIACALLCLLVYQTIRSLHWRAFLLAIPVFVAPLFSGILLRVQPVDDLPYYFATTASLICAAISFIGVIYLYNGLVTDPAPRLFQREGGDPQ